LAAIINKANNKCSSQYKNHTQIESITNEFKVEGEGYEDKFIQIPIENNNLVRLVTAVETGNCCNRFIN